MSNQKLTPSRAARLYVSGTLKIDTLDNPARLELMQQVMDEYRLTKRELAAKLDYSPDYVYGWFVTPDSDRFRPVHDRALKSLLMVIQNGLIK
jgi:hypothetical protein